MTETPENDSNATYAWGATNIGRIINTPPRRTFYLLENGLIPAKKIGGKWCADIDQLRAFMKGELTEKTIPPEKLTPRPKSRAA
jgi:hypothetical protein